MQSSPPQSNGKAQALRELSRSFSHSPRDIPSVSPPASDSNPTQRSGFGATNSEEFWDNDDVLQSTQHKLDDDTNALPQYPRIRSTAKKINSWQMQRSEALNPDTSMVNKQFNDFDQSASDEEDVSVEQARGGHRSNRSTPAKRSSSFQAFDSLYDMTPPSRSRKTYAAETGSLRRDAQIRRASRNDLDTASPRPTSTRNSQALPINNERKRTSLAQLHAKVSADESSFAEERPPHNEFPDQEHTVGWFAQPTNVPPDRWQCRRSLSNSGHPRSRPTTAQTTAQSFVLPDMPNLTELVSGVFQDGTPVFSKNTPARFRPTAPNGRKPFHLPVDSVPIPDEEKAIFAGLQLLQDKVAQMEHERAEAEKKIEEQELEIIELKSANDIQDKIRRNDSALGSTDGEGSGKTNWKVEKTRLDATVQTLRTKLDRAERKIDVLDIEKKRLSSERDNMAGQLGVAFQNFEEVKTEKEALRLENDYLRQEIDTLRAENESLHDRLEQEEMHRRDETGQLRRQVDRAENVTQRENVTLRAELARVRAQYDENTQNLTRKNTELRKARKDQAEYARLKTENDSLKAQMENLRARREVENHRWANREAELKSKVDRRDATIRLFEDETQEQTNEAMRLDNNNLRQELAQIAAQHEDDNRQWSMKEAELQRKIKQRNGVADMAREVLGSRHANDQRVNESAPVSADKENGLEEPTSKSTYRPDDNTRTRTRNRVQQESRNIRTVSASHPPTQGDDSTRRSFIKITRAPRASPGHSTRSVSAPIINKKNAEQDDTVESTTDLSLAPRGTPYVMHGAASGKPMASIIEPPVDLDLTDLSYFPTEDVAQVRRNLEEDRIAARNKGSFAPLKQTVREDTVRSERPTREDTVRSEQAAHDETGRSLVSTRRPSLPRKSSLKDVTAKTNVTQFEEDATGDVSNLDAADGEPTQTKESAVDISMLSNTSRRRRSAPTEMTSAFILPDIEIDSHKQGTTRIVLNGNITGRHHDNGNCIVCRRNAANPPAGPLRVPKLVPVSSRMPDDVDATLRPVRSPAEALALVVKELQDERAHLHVELCVLRGKLECHDVSLGARERKSLDAGMHEALRLISIKDTQIYNLYDVLEGQQQGEHELTEQNVEELTREIRVEDETAKKMGKEKKVTIQSYIDTEDEHSAHPSGGSGDEEDLPWEGFEDSQSVNLAGLQARRSSVY